MHNIESLTRISLAPDAVVVKVLLHVVGAEWHLIVLKEPNESEHHNERADLGQHDSADNLEDVGRPGALFGHEEDQAVQIIREQESGLAKTCHGELRNAGVLNQTGEQLGRQHDRVRHQQV